ncbi:PREDICTED: countin-1-like [Amphimedon queenslandica]|uniref:Saposin B-type domain-containing protein n=1 Tax=Amphimedon queenslandica TaxID=400682 RepID=A0A1X7VLP5_AMPQE|nr:PREDICTED: countin-1-like [Amphimedon queenslandica]|eukprot:XP_003383827.1 PREDICTED: countin-1-like [Amphimedon queenslandica]
MKLAFFLVLLLLGQNLAAAPSRHHDVFQKKLLPRFALQIESPNADYKYCGLCINFADQFLQNLLNLILNVGVIGGCTDLCGMLPGSNVEKEVCEVLCSVAGFYEFVQIIQEADLDPIYYCELLNQCEIKDDGDATITDLTVKPKLVPRGSTFEISFTFATKNGTGTGEVYLGIDTRDGIPLDSSELLKPLPAGQSVSTDGTVSAEPGRYCIEEGICEEWIPGNYTIVVAVCNGQCGSNHPHSQLYDLKRLSFNITEDAI